ncbi:intermembrane phospholipid transport protein YdbH family protein [Gallaecimonas pentaromativorans]|uniref:intermembrane phospholipid transport protein YdbH family protein n=1 Tax=Gallaecimonas pentaromativorans TaxID=584787 RepID=UPI003A93E266
MAVLKWGAAVLVGLAVVVALALAWLWPRGLSLTGLGWGHAEQLVYRQQGCELVKARGLNISGIWPLQLSADALAVSPCPGGGSAGIPAFPKGRLSITKLSYQDLPAIGVELTSLGDSLEAKIHYQQSLLALHWQLPDGQFTFTGTLEDVPPTQGVVSLSGSGLFDGKLQQLSAKAQSDGLSVAGQRLALVAAAKLEGDAWQLDAQSRAPLAVASFTADWQLHGAGRLDGTLALTGSADVGSPLGPLHLAASSRDLQQASWQLGGQGITAQGTLSRQWLTVSSAKLAQAGGELSLTAPLQLALAGKGQAPISLAGQYQQLKLDSQGQLSWQPGQVNLAGSAGLAGRFEGQDIKAKVPFELSQAQLSLAPFTLAVSGDYGKGALVNSATQVLHFNQPALSLGLDWQYQGKTLNGTVTLAKDQTGLLGGIKADSSALLDKGGAAHLVGAYRLSPEPMLLAGSYIRFDEGLIQQNLLLPAELNLATNLLFKGGLNGQLAIKGQGLVRSDARVPAWQGQLTLAGQQGRWQLSIPRWQGQLGGDFQRQLQRWRGKVQGHLALGAGVSQALPVTFEGGELALDGNWQWPALKAAGKLTVRHASGLWGASAFQGGAADFNVDFDKALSANGSASLAGIDIGTPVTGLEGKASYQEGQWHFRDIQAALLGGSLSAKALDWPGSTPQPVALDDLNLASIAALQAKPVVALSGRVSGRIPMVLGPDGISIVGGELANTGPVAIEVLNVDSVQSLKASNTGVKVALDALGNLAVDTLNAGFDMNKDGQATLKVLIKGHNPQQDLPVNLHYSHQENLRQLLRSLRIGDEVADKVKAQLKEQGDKP